MSRQSQLVQREIDDMGITIDVSDIPVLREPIDRAAREGLEQGIEQGRSAGMSEMLTALLERTFGDLPAEILAEIGELPTDRLTELALGVADIESLDQLRVCLDLPVDAVPSTVPTP